MVQKRLRLLVLISTVLLLAIAGCGKGGDDTISAASPFLGGSQGLEIKFLGGSPPDEITNANFPFQAIVSIKNVGEHDITKNQVRVDLSGILASDFGSGIITNIIPADDPSSRKKDSEGNIIEAIETFATIPQGGNLQLLADKIKGNTKFTFRADVCYQYQTDAIGSLCVLSNMIDIANDAICIPKGSRAISSSGSPVKITSFRQSVVGERKIQFSFDIVHSGSGNVFENKAPSGGGCPKNPSNKRIEENKLDVTVATGIPQTLTCVGIGSGTGSVTSNNVRLVDGKRTITCTQDVPASDFERNVDINIKFNYQDSIDKEVLAKKLESGTTQQQPLTTGGVTLPVCSSSAVPNTKCMPQSCTAFFQPCTDASSSCRCETSGFSACTGACTSVTDTTGPIVGGIEPLFAKSGSSQIFVIYDAYDAESGVNSCIFKSTTTSGVALFPGTKQGAVNCQTVNDCDFWTSIPMPSITGGNIKIDAICTNSKGITNEQNDPAFSLVSVLDAPQISPDLTDATIPEIGSVIQDVGLKNIITDVGIKDQSMMILAIGIRDKESGVKKCDLFLPGQQPGTDTLVISGVIISGLRKTMTLQGPQPCMGTEKGQAHGSCSAWVQHTFIATGTLSSYIECENGKGLKNVVNFLTNIR